MIFRIHRIFVQSLTRLSFEFYSLDDALPFFHNDELIGSQVSKRIDLTTRPADRKALYPLIFAQSEMNPQIVLRVITTTAADLIDLSPVLSNALDPRPNAVSIGLNADELDLYPVVLIQRVCAK